MRSSSKNGNAVGCLIIFAVVLGVGLIQSIVRYFQDKPLYAEAHAAYLVGDCSTALPIFDVLVNKFRFIDFGRLKDKSSTQAIDCRQYQLALEKGISGLYEYAINQPNNGLVSTAKKKAEDLLINLTDMAENMTILGNDTCSKQDDLVNSGWLNENTLPKFAYYCAKVLLADGYAEEAIGKLTFLLQNYPESEMAGLVWKTLETSVDFCPLLPEMSSDPAFNISRDKLPDFYLSCGRNLDSVSDYDQAVVTYQAFLDQFPDHPLAEEVKKLLAAALIAQARASGSGTIEKPDTSGYAPAGISRVVIQNDSPHDLKLVFSGPDALIEELPACPECTDYSMMGPMYCPEQGAIGTYELTPGQYEVLVETTHEENIIPFTGTWNLEGGSEFYSCFFVVTSFY